jgi:DNA-binding NarL/FixJ family response regulator
MASQRNISAGFTQRSIWIADDDRQFCMRLCQLLHEHNYQHLSIFHTCETVLERAANKNKRPDLLLLDINFSSSKMSGYGLLKQSPSYLPSTKIIMMTAFGEEEHLRLSLQNGALGFINKMQPPEDVLRAIGIVLYGGVFAKPETLSKILSPSGFDDSLAKQYGLTHQEKNILRCLLDGVPVRVIAEKYFISLNTVNFHIKNIHKKMNVRSTSQMIAKLHQEKTV